VQIVLKYNNVNKIIKPCSRLSTLRGSRSIMHTEITKKLTWPWPSTCNLEIQ